MRTAIEVGSGELLDLANPDPALIRVEDIASALSKICRFTGHVTRFYSVAEHAVLTSRLVAEGGGDLKAQYEALHHDDAEAYIGDVSTPLKAMLPDYRAIERRLVAAVKQALSVTSDRHEAVHAADRYAVVIEAQLLLPSGGAWLDHRVTLPERFRLRPWGAEPVVAKQGYLNLHRVLAEGLGL